MARRRIAAAALLAAAASLLVIGQLCNATQSEAEEFWGTVLPNSPLPDAVLKILHLGTNSVNQEKDAEGKMPRWLSRLVPSGDENTPDENTRHMSRLIPFFYAGHTRPSVVPSGDGTVPDQNTGHLSRLIPFFYSRHTRQSTVPSGDDNVPDEKTGHMSRLIPFFYSRHTWPSAVPSGDGTIPDQNTGHLSRLIPFFYSRHTRQSTVPSGDDIVPVEKTGHMSRLIPFFYSGYRRSSPVPLNNDNTGAQQLIRFPLFNHDKASHKHLSPRTSIDDDTVGAAVLSVIMFREEALQVGKNMTMYFPPAVTAPLGLLPRNVADSIPFSKSSLLGLLAQLGIAVDSVQAAYMQLTLDMCTSPSPGEENHFCATSLEALVEGVIERLGSNDIRPITSTLSPSGAPLQPYIIRGVRPVEGSSFLACHDLDYPYSIYTCHSPRAVRVYMVDMEATADGDMATMVTVCHTDTSKWNPEHLSFKLLGTKPGGAPVCHTVPYGNILWAKNVMASDDQQA